MWYGSGPGTWVGWLTMSIMMVLFWGGIIALVVWLVRGSRWYSGTSETRSGTADPKAILQERFARGEIDADDYQERMRVLSGAASHAPTQNSPASPGPAS